MKRNLDSLVRDNVIVTPGKRQAKDVPLPTSDEIATSHQKLSNTGSKAAVRRVVPEHCKPVKLSSSGSKAAVLRVVPEHCKAFKPIVLANNFPPVLTDLFERLQSKLPFSELLNKCDEVEIIVTQEQAKCVEQATKKQIMNKLWFRFRSGRVTASKMKRICRSNPDQPSQPPVKTVYPEAASFIVAATQLGYKHGDVARASMQNKCRHPTTTSNWNYQDL